MNFCIGWYDGDLKKTLGMLKLKSSLLYVNCVYVLHGYKDDGVE